jgi:hypothetical protein
MENPWKTLLTQRRAPEALRTRNPRGPALLQPLRELDRGHPLPLPARMQDAGCLGRRKGASRPYLMGLRPNLLPTCCSRRCSGCGRPGVWGQHTTIEISTPRGRDAHPTRAPPTKRSGTSIGPDDLADATAGAPRGGHLRLARRSYQIVSTRSSSVIFRSRVTSGSSNAIAVALMKRSHGSPSASRGIR